MGSLTRGDSLIRTGSPGILSGKRWISAPSWRTLSTCSFGIS